MSAPRILFCGDVNGRLTQLYKRVASVSKGAAFDALFCVGQFFPDDEEEEKQFKDYIDGLSQIPLPTYFIGNYGRQASQLLESAKSKAQDLALVTLPVPLCDNLYWLKGSGVVCVHGLRILYLGGKYDGQVFEDQARASAVGAFHRDDVDALRALADEPQVTDVLLTNEWPRGVLAGSSIADCPQVVGIEIISELAVRIKPRYHIVASEGHFFTREPYSNWNASHVTRFVALGKVGNDKKQKYLHALSPAPAANLSAEELAVKPPNTTPLPYAEALVQSKKRTMPEPSATPEPDGQYWRFHASSDAKRHKPVEAACYEFISKGSCSRGEKCKFKHTFDNGVPFPRKSCFDFINKGSCEKGSECKFHHVTEDNVQATETVPPPKGVCFHFFKRGSCDKGDSCRFSHTTEQKSTALPGPCWFCLSSPDVETHLVVSVGEHCYCAIAKGPLVDDHILIVPIEHVSSTTSVSSETRQELRVYKDALRKLYESQGKAMLVFERYIHLRAGTHAHLQVVPIPSRLASVANEAFQEAAKQLGFTFVVFPTGSQSYELKRLLDGVNYFFAELPDGNVLAHPCSAGERMPLQFGREVVAKLLDIPEKADWKACKLSNEQETELANAFKQQFQAYDPMNA